MSDTYGRWQQWTERARAIVECDGENCGTSTHISAIRYLAMEAYDNGLLDGIRQERERS